MEGSTRVIRLAASADTEALGETVGRALGGGEVIALSGPLGAGKTTFVRGLARGLGIDEEFCVSSPTFTLIQAYPCRSLTLYHLDLYRICGPDDAESTGYRDLLGRPDAVLAIEWADREPGILPDGRLEVALDYDGVGEGRVARLGWAGERFGRVVETPG
jgi:tRNA threonylcarbamoyladenosine biosynthesis protein TsaE